MTYPGPKYIHRNTSNSSTHNNVTIYNNTNKSSTNSLTRNYSNSSSTNSLKSSNHVNYVNQFSHSNYSSNHQNNWGSKNSSSNSLYSDSNKSSPNHHKLTRSKSLENEKRFQEIVNLCYKCNLPLNIPIAPEIDTQTSLNSSPKLLRPQVKELSLIKSCGRYYHSNCFTCEYCKSGSKLEEGFTSDAHGKIVCLDCFHQTFAPKCNGCKQPITPSGGRETVRIIVNNYISYHIDCFNWGG